MFKKLLSCILVTLLLVSVLSVGLTAVAYDEAQLEAAGILGDADGDLVTDTDDAILVLRVASGVEAPLTGNELIRSDIDQDGIITVKDARAILRAAMRLDKLGPTGAFKGFSGGGVFATKDELVEYFNTHMNAVKDEMAGFTKSTDSTVTDVKIAEFNAGGKEINATTLVESLMDKISDSSEANNQLVTQPKGISSDGNMSIEGQSYVSALTAADLFGASAESKEGVLTIKIALKDVSTDEVGESSYSRCMNTENMNTQAESIITSVFSAASKDSDNLKLEYMNGVLTATFNEATGRVMSYSTIYYADVYVVEASMSGSGLSGIPIIGGIFGSLSVGVKGVEYTSINTVDYTNFNW